MAVNSYVEVLNCQVPDSNSPKQNSPKLQSDKKHKKSIDKSDKKKYISPKSKHILSP